MGGLVKRSLIAIILALSISSVAAWAPETRVRMVDEAIRLMPASLRLALQAHREQLVRGMLEPMVGEDGAAHRPSWAEGSLESALEVEATALVEALGRGAPFDEIARRFGALAHYVSDAGFPPGVGGEATDRRYAHFAAFCESRRERFPLVFYGHDDEDLARGDYRAFAERTITAAAEDDRRLARIYAKAGDPPDPVAFDDRSVPFAVGSLSYSRSITHIVRAWLTAWQSADGDMGRTPYWKPS